MNRSNKPLRAVSLRGHYAGFATRMIAFVLDLIILSVSVLFFSWFIHSTFQVLLIEGMAKYIKWIGSILDFISDPTVTGIASICFIIFYYVFFWTFSGQTIGKAIMGIKIIPNNGARMSIIRSLIRYFGYLISTILFGLGFLWILVDERRLAWHDRLAGTCVVYVWDARPDEKFLVEVTAEMDARNQPKQQEV
jgi:uncharacterized RDD family membrane protein YckC